MDTNMINIVPQNSYSFKGVKRIVGLLTTVLILVTLISWKEVKHSLPKEQMTYGEVPLANQMEIWDELVVY